MNILCFFAGTAFFYDKSIYSLLLLGALFLFKLKPTLLCWFFAAWILAVVHQWLISPIGMPDTRVIKQAHLLGLINSIPTHTPSKTQFQFRAQSLNGKPIDTTILLSGFDGAPEFHAGETWDLTANIKKPINYANPGGFDYVGLLSSRHIEWIGILKKGTAYRVLSPRYPSLLILREHLAKTLQILVPENDLLGIFEALTLGLTSHIDAAHWDLYRRTGTTHLIDISGEHIALIAGLFYWLFKWLWRHLGAVCLIFPAQKIAGIAAIVFSMTYTLIAGFSVPTQRSLIACCLVLSRHFKNQPLSIWQTWRYGLFLVLLLEPHAVKMIGFYFSFIAVAILILINQRFHLKKIKKLLLMQVACLLGLMPLSLYWFSYASINGFLANLFAIPWVGFIIVPMALGIAALSPWGVIPGSVPLLKGAILVFLYVLEHIDTLDQWNLNATFIDALSPIALMGIMLLGLVYPSFRLIPVALVCLIASVFPNYEKIRMNDATIDVLDVGQGLAVAVRTAHHVLIYDTGMAFYQGGDIGKSVITPYLNHLGIKHLDKVIISHPDLDHRGGLNSLQKAFPIEELIVNDPHTAYLGGSCHHHSDWQWDGVSFHFFPILTQFPGRNNNSCVLQIKNNAGIVLLDADIEKIAEDYLITTYGTQLASTIMLIPHHASKGSSSNAFIQQVAPKYAIASYGFDNRYHFPHPKALLTYEAHHVTTYHTPDCGMVRVHMKPLAITPRCYR
ncbi:MAG: DNA internalization-related competence protein ComEC/Rec2 [Legionellales bacterium]|nr:DNA internalization-related competence protein ComEC/Rec2 [Legionellales bacterium]